MKEMGSLSGCILENDPETQDRARWAAGWWSRRCHPIAAATILLKSTGVRSVVRHHRNTKRLGYAWSALNLPALRFPATPAGMETPRLSAQVSIQAQI